MDSIIDRKKVSSQVLERIKDNIKSGEFPAGEKLPSEMELARQFGVSRAPIREALSILSASGIVELRQGGGSRVNAVPLVDMLEQIPYDVVKVEEVHDLLEMRSVIEVEAAAFAAVRHTSAEEDELKEALEEFSKTVADQKEVGAQADFSFHRVILKAARNPFLEQTMNNVSGLLQKALDYSLSQNVGRQEKREEVYEEHQVIYEAFCRRDPEAARTAMRTHLENARRKLGDTRVDH
ncbi:FadR/GntR family transcriptional regulator [Sinobaca sp. H24]|uniref:FadR/GntR family transcriptional regulator n=1 Tax=Sinobaca sp. H24 TaxID=2923376 RepID=UPI00207AFA8B|nr:FadR/GntR family transcriptional regulator [Sinobaca sp. H24]